MILGVQEEIWIVAAFCVVFNLTVTLLITNVIAKKAFKRGYQAAQVANEALALGRLMETSRERYYAGDALARALEESRGDLEAFDPSDPAD